jgi:hypothetical protein
MRALLVALLLGVCLVAEAAPLASATVEVDGATQPVELDARGTLRIGSATLALDSAPAHATISSATIRGVPTVVVDTDANAYVFERTGGAWKRITEVSTGGVGLDAEYTYHVHALPLGVLRYQSRPGYHRCDGKPALLFAEGFDGTKFRRLSKIPTEVPADAQVITAHIDPSQASAPQLYQARVASVQPGAGDAGGLGIPSELDDGKPATAWREELASDGEGQWFTFEPRAGAAHAAQIRIVPGNQASQAALKASNRPRRIAIVSASGAWHIDIPDAVGEPLGTAFIADLPAPVGGCVTAILEATYGPPNGTTMIGELEVFADGERAGGGEAALAKIVAAGADGTRSAEQQLARTGAAGVTALDAELQRATDGPTRGRLVHAILLIHDPSAGPILTRAIQQRWVQRDDLAAVVAALAVVGQPKELHDLALDEGLPLDARIAAVRGLATQPATLVELAGQGPREVRHETIVQLSAQPVATLAPAAQAASSDAAAGDLWRAVTRRARATPDERAPALAALAAALPTAADYERRYRLVDGLAALGDTPQLQAVADLLAKLEPGAEHAALAQVAALAIAVNPRPEALPLLLQLARDADPGVRLATLSAFATTTGGTGGAWHGPEGPDAIDRVIQSALVSDTWPEVRRRAAQVLGGRCQRPGPAHSLVESIARDPDAATRGDALAALVECKAPGTAELLAKVWASTAAPLELRQRAVELAVQLGDRALADRLVTQLDNWRAAALDSEDALALTQSAAYAVGRLAPPRAADVLIAALDDIAYPEIVAAAATGLGLMGPSCPRTAIPKLRQLAHSDERQIQAAAARAAAVCGH